MRTFFILLVTLLLISSVRAQTISGSQPKELTSQDIISIKRSNVENAAAIRFQYFVIKADSNTYGYSIYADGKLFIRQTTIPGLPGLTGLKEPSQADRLARLVINKIKEGEMPPTITPGDLRKLNILQ